MYLAAPGLVCSVGLDADSAAAAMRAGIAQFEETGYLDNDGQPIIGAAVPGLDRTLTRGERLIQLLTLAITECLGKLPPVARPQQIPIIVCLSERNRPGGAADLARNIVGRIEHALGVSFHSGRSGAVAMGHTAAFRALRVARKLLDDDEIPACLVCGVDSYINAASLDWLERSERLKTEDESDGVIPGEAAAACLVTASRPGAPGQAVRIKGLGFATEAATVLSTEVLHGDGLADAARKALADARMNMREIDFRVSDVTGESYGFREQILATARLMRVVKQEFPIWHAADSVGDTGAAAGLCQLIMSASGFSQGYAPGTRALCCTSAVGGARAAAIVEHPAA